MQFAMSSEVGTQLDDDDGGECLGALQGREEERAITPHSTEI